MLRSARTGSIFGASIRRLMLRALLALIALTCTSAYAGSAYLTWSAPTTNTDGSPLTNLAGYRIYRGCSQPGQYELGTVDALDSSITSYSLTGLPDVGTCYFAVSALNSAGTQSALSNEASKPMGQLEAPGQPSLFVTWSKSPPMAIAKVYRTAIGANGTPATSLTTGSFDSTGYTHIVVGVKHEGAVTTITPSDNKSTTGWTSLTKETVAAASDDLHGQLHWAKIGSPGTGHTATATFAASRPYRTVAG